MLFCQCNAMHRRDVVCGGGAAVFSAIIATLMGSSKPVKAEVISARCPSLIAWLYGLWLTAINSP
jgi:7,8-dihydropterin-6-yl-methyl-4-(beta-D-ribofuranosyl)aminobenzene 5'-phosphate synthase